MTRSARNPVPLTRKLAAEPDSRPIRYFVGLELVRRSFEIQAALIRVTGCGLSSEVEIVDTATTNDRRIELAVSAEPTTDSSSLSAVALGEATQSAFLTEVAAEIVQSMTSTFSADDGMLMACASMDSEFGSTTPSTATAICLDAILHFYQKARA